MKEIFGFLAAFFGTSGGVIYVRAILKGATKPHRVSWAIWAALGILTLSSYLAKGARWSALLALSAAINSIVIFSISLKFGMAGMSLVDRIALALGLLGLLLWVMTRQAAYALLFVIAADLIATLLTVYKAYKNPHTENAVAWALGVIASIFGLLAVQSYTFWQTIYPVYGVVGGLCLALVTIFRRLGVDALQINKK